jgi:hypothetical protein
MQEGAPGVARSGHPLEWRASAVKIRLVGTLEECLYAQELLNKAFEIVETSRPYPSREPSRLVRVYVEVRFDPERIPPTPAERPEPRRQRVTLRRADRELPAR